MDLPSEIRSNIKKAKSILSKIGCKEIYIFGSFASGNYNNNSDLDLAVKGCPSEKYYYAIGKLISELDYNIDLVDLDKKNNFNKLLEQSGELKLVE